MWKYNAKSNSVDEEDKFGTYIFKSIPVQGEVKWKDGEDVTGKFKEERQPSDVFYIDEEPDDYWRIVAIPISIQEQPFAHCRHLEIEDTGVGYYKCIFCGEHIRHDLWHKNQSQEQPTESEDELWQEVFRQCKKWQETINDNRTNSQFIDDIKKQFTITRNVKNK